MICLRHLLLVILFSFVITTPLLPQDSAVTMIDKGSYYELVLDYNTGISRFEMGKLVAQKILQFIPDIEALTDKLLTESTGNQEFYNVCLARMNDIKPQIQEEYIEETTGIISVLCSVTDNIRGDNKLSPDEFYVTQLSDDVIRASQCSSVSVFGERSAAGSAIAGKILDYPDPDFFQSKTQAITTIKNGSKSICKIGSLSVGGGTIFNDDGIFVSLHDSPIGTAYSSENKCAYLMDIRYTLENFSTMDEVVNYFTERSGRYVTNRLFQIADKDRVIILENNFSGPGSNVRCGVRTDTSRLNPGVTWELPGAIGTANSFVLEGNCDNHTLNLYCTKRWESIKSQLLLFGEKINFDELKQILSFDNGDGPGSQEDGDLYNEGTIMITVFQPDIFKLNVAFKPRSGILLTDPVFEDIPVYIGNPTTAVKDKPSVNSYGLEQNYPNPFNPTTKIEYEIKNPGFVSLKVYDILGSEVATLVNEIKPSGRYSVSFDAAKYNLAAGSYVYCLKSGDFISAKKIVLLK